MTGNYLFNLVVDDAAVVYLSKSVNETDINNMEKMDQILFEDTHVGNDYIPFVKPTIQNDKNITLSEGYYYMHIVTFDWGWDAGYKLMVTTPPLPGITLTSI